MVKQKLDKHSRPRRVMAKSRQVVVLRPSMRQPSRPSRRHRVARGFGRGISGARGALGNIRRTLDPYATALGMGTIFVAAGSKVSPNMSMQMAQFVGLAGEYVGGGIKGAIGAEVIKALVGAPSILTSFNLGGLFGGGGGQPQMPQGGNSAFL